MLDLPTPEFTIFVKNSVKKMTNTRVVMIAGDTAFCERIALALGSVPGYEILGCPRSVSEALELLREQIPSLVLLESNPGPGGAITFLPRARALGFNGPVVVLTSGLTLTEGAAFVQQGVSAICPKNQSIAALLEGVQLAVKGVTTIEERYFRAATKYRAGVGPDLSEREWQIIDYLMGGLSNKQIALRIRMSEATVKAALRRIYDATGVRSRSRLVCMLFDPMRQSRLAG